MNLDRFLEACRFWLPFIATVLTVWLTVPVQGGVSP